MTGTQEQQVETQIQALNVLVQSVELAQKRGAYNLAEAALISQAVKIFVTSKVEEVAPSQESEEVEDES
jgi:hypothetical protein